jgi:hypothetical protein
VAKEVWEEAQRRHLKVIVRWSSRCTMRSTATIPRAMS